MDEIKSELNKISIINWKNAVIILEFFSCLDLDTLKEVSLLSKIIRIKLKPKLFKSISFNGRLIKNFSKNYENLLYGYFVCKKKLINCPTDNKITYSYSKEDEIEPSLHELQDELITYKPFANCFNFSNLGCSGYYMFPLLNIFQNLTILKLRACFIPLICFNKLSKALPKLTTLGIISCNFSKIQNDESELEYIQFPKTLKNLTLFYINICITEKMPNPYDYLYTHDYIETSIDFTLPSDPMPTLLKLKVSSEYFNGSDLSLFLHNNPQLEYFYFESEYIDQHILDILEKSQSLRTLKIYCDNPIVEDITIPTLNSITQLKFTSIYFALYPFIYELCLSTPNLKVLHIETATYTNPKEIIAYLVKIIIPKAYNLKELKLSILISYNVSADFTNLYHVEKLIIESSLKFILNAKFENFSNLKKFIFYINESDTQLENLKRMKFQNIKNWSIFFNFEMIKGIRLYI